MTKEFFQKIVYFQGHTLNEFFEALKAFAGKFITAQVCVDSFLNLNAKRDASPNMSEIRDLSETQFSEGNQPRISQLVLYAKFQFLKPPLHAQASQMLSSAKTLYCTQCLYLLA